MNKETIIEYIDKYVMITVKNKTIYCIVLCISSRKGKAYVRDERVKYHVILLVDIISLKEISQDKFYSLPDCKYQ